MREITTIASIASVEPHSFSMEAYFSELSIPYGYGRQTPTITPSLIDLNLPINLLNAMTPKPPAPIKKMPIYLLASDDNPTSTVSTFNNSEISLRRWLSVCKMFRKYLQRGEHSIRMSPEEYPSHVSPSHRQHPKLKRRKWAWEVSFQKERECCSICAKPAGKMYRRKGAFSGHRGIEQTE